MKGMTLQIKDVNGESVYGCYIVLLHSVVHDLLYLAGYTVFATLLFMTWQTAQCSSGTANDDTHNTVCALTRLAGCIVFI